MSYRIFMDMSADVDSALISAHDIGCVPMEYSVGDDMHTSYGPEADEFMIGFYNGQRGGDLTRTTQISPYAYSEYFRPFLAQGISCLYISLSSGLSATFQSASLAAEELNDEFPGAELLVLDSRTATVGIGLLLERAVLNQDSGMTIRENFDDLSEAVKRLRIRFMVQNLTYLHRGGRVNAATATVANVLDLKPILIIDEKGELVTINKKRGNRPALNQLLAYLDEDMKEHELEDVIYVVHSDVSDFADYLVEEAGKRCPGKAVKKNMLCPIIGAHTGPGLAAVTYMLKD